MNTRLTLKYFIDIITRHGHTAFYKLSDEDRAQAIEIFKKENELRLCLEGSRIHFINKSFPVAQIVQDTFIDAVLYLDSGHKQKEIKKSKG